MNEPRKKSSVDRPRSSRGRSAVWQARLVLLVMINIAQLWTLSATVEAALAGQMNHLIPLVVASLVCWLIGLTIILWWKPAATRRPRTSYYVDDEAQDNRL